MVMYIVRTTILEVQRVERYKFPRNLHYIFVIISVNREKPESGNAVCFSQDTYEAQYDQPSEQVDINYIATSTFSW